MWDAKFHAPPHLLGVIAAGDRNAGAGACQREFDPRFAAFEEIDEFALMVRGPVF